MQPGVNSELGWRAVSTWHDVQTSFYSSSLEAQQEKLYAIPGGTRTKQEEQLQENLAG